MELYFNHAGTAWPKPAAVEAAVADSLTSPPADWNGGYEKALRTHVEFFNIPDPARFLFTTGATASLSFALSDFEWKAGDRIVTSRLEHHALSRQLVKLSLEREVVYSRAPYRPDMPFDLDFLRAELKRGGVRLVAFSHASNVTGDILPAKEIVELAHKYDALVLMDCAQTAGVIPIDVAELGADIFIFAGHKGPRGPQGIGGLYIDPKVPLYVPAAVCEPDPDASTTPECTTMLSYCDLGSVNMAAMAGLAAGLDDLSGRGWVQLTMHRLELNAQLYDGLAAIDGILTHGNSEPAKRTRAISITKKGKPTAEFARALLQKGIRAGAGFFCSPWAHEALDTTAGGTIRLSYGPETTAQEIGTLLAAIESIR